MDWSEFLGRVQAFLDTVLFRRRAAGGSGWTTWTVGDLLLAAIALGTAYGVSWILRRLLRRPAGDGSAPPGGGQTGGGQTGEKPSGAFHRLLHWGVMAGGAILALEALHLYPAGLFDFRLFRIKDVDVTVFSLVAAGGIVLASLVLSRLLQGIVRRSLAADSPQARASVRTLSQFVHYAVVLIAVALALPTLGIDIGALIAVGGVFVLALGFAMKELTENFVSGVILLGERAIKPGDILEVEGTVVRVSAIGIRTTLGTTRDGEELIIPNSTLVGTTVKNLTYNDSLYRIRVQVGVSYDSDMKRVFAVLRACAEGLTWRAPDRTPEIYLVGFGSSSVDFDVVLWIQDPWRMRRASSDLRDAIWWALKDAGLVIAYPQVDVHLDPAGLRALAGRAAPQG